MRALAIGTLVSEAVSIFADNQSLILAGGLEKSLIDYSAHSAAIKDIISLSVKHLYQAEEVVEKEIAGYQILSKLVEVCSKALIAESKAEASIYDQLILSKIPHQFRSAYDQRTYNSLLNASSFVASLSDSQAIGLHQTIQGIF